MAYYKFGDRVEKKILHGRLAGCWVPARVIQSNEKRMTVGVYMLNHRGYKLSKYHMQVPLCNIRRPQHKYQVKERIFTKILRGRRKGMWIPAMILKINRDQTYDMMVENHRYHQVTKYAVHVPLQYIVPANFTVKKRTMSTTRPISLAKSQRERKSSELKTCAHKHNISSEEKKVSEMKPSERSLNNSEARVCDEPRISEICEDDIFAQTCDFLSPERSKSGEPVRKIRIRENQEDFYPRALSISVEQRRLGSAGATPTSLQVHINQHKPSCYELGFFTKSAADLKIEAYSHQAVSQQKSDEHIRPKTERRITDWGDEFEYEGISPRFSFHPSSEMTDESCFSPRVFSSDDQIIFPSLPGQCTQLNNRVSTSSPRTSGNRSSMSQLSAAAKSHHSRKSIMTLGVNGQNMRLNEIGMDTSLDEIARWLAEGSKNKSGDSSARSSRQRMVSMMSFRKNNVPILSKKRKESNLDMLSEKKEYKLSDLLVGTSVDTSKQGLAIFVGPVDGQLSYKVEVFEKKHMPNNNLVSKKL